jgi:hypothetical protein
MAIDDVMVTFTAGTGIGQTQKLLLIMNEKYLCFRILSWRSTSGNWLDRRFGVLLRLLRAVQMRL